MAHEAGSTVLTEPFPGLTKYKGAWVSRFVLSNTGAVVSGSAAHGNLFLENTFFSATPPLQGAVNSFTRFCSGVFAGRETGLDRPFFFTNEESGTGNFDLDVKGSQTVAITDGKMYTVPDLGRMARETTIIQPRRDNLLVALSTEDGANPSYIYLYVGRKQIKSTSPLDRNGLTNGKIYTLCGRDAQHNEGTFTTGTLPVKWKEIPNGAGLTSEQLRAAADLAGAFGFIRVEDAEFDPAQPTRSVFMSTTGGSGPNMLGRLYELTMNPANPLANGTLNVVYNADMVATPGGTFNGTIGRLNAANGITGSLGTYAGGDINAITAKDYPVSIDNIAVSQNFIVVCEDTNAPANAIYTKYARNSGTWTLDRNASYAAKLQATFNYAYTETRDGNTLASTTAGRWETSGVIRSDEIFGAGTFVINVQAHPQTAAYHRTTAPKPAGGVYTKAEALSLFAEDGQVLIMRPTP